MSMLKDLSGKTYTAANGQKTYEVFYASASLVPVIGELIQEHFGFAPVSKPVIGLGKVRLSAQVLLNSLISAEMIKIQSNSSLISPSA